MALHRILLVWILAGATLGLMTPTLRAGDPRRTAEVEIYERVKAAVVDIQSERAARAAQPEELLPTVPSQNRINGMGTGIIIDARGYIITNQHVVDDVNLIRVKFVDGTSASARVVTRDQENDLALLKVDVSQNLTVMPLGTSSDVMVGEPVIAIGNAYGYTHTMSKGIVSAVKRDVTLNKDISYKLLIQTDAAINPGNSGGPLINIKGELIGVNVAIRAGAQNIGFAIPVDSVIRVTAAMMASRRKNPTVHGLICRDKFETENDLDAKSVKLKTDEGTWSPIVRRSLIVDKVEANSPAGKAGIQAGDTLVQVGDLKVANALDLERALMDRAPGDKLPCVVRRKNDEQKLELALQAPERNGPSVAEVIWKKLGVRLSVADAEGITRSNPQLHGGLNVLDVRPDSTASRSGIQKGDILVGLHQWEMLSVDNVSFVLTHPDLQTFIPLRFFLLRSGQVHRGWIQQLD
jgi:serine protease Do